MHATPPVLSDSRVATAWGRISARVSGRSVPRTVAFLFGAGLLLRVLVMALYPDVVLTYYGGDATRYLRLPFTGYHGLFSDPNIPAGYPAFLDAARWVSRNIVFTIGLQHLMGLATA